MKQLTFKVSSQENNSVVSLIKEVNKISCRIHLDLENGIITVEKVDDAMIDTVIELINNYYTILGVDIDNVNEEPTSKQIQSEDNLIIQKVEFENEYVQNRINNFLKTAYWALYNREATEKEVGEYILTCQTEISMRYSSKPSIEFTIGDIIDVNYGAHLPGEINGGHVYGIVCNILHDNLAYVVPITKSKTDIFSNSYLFMEAFKDATYNNGFCNSVTVLLNKGKYLRTERFYSVIGKVNADFFNKLLEKLASTFDFTNQITKTVNKNDNLPFTMKNTINEVAKASTVAKEVAETSVSTEKTANTVVKSKYTTKKSGSEETALLECIGFAFDKLDSSKKVEEQIDTFLTDIGMTTTERMVTQSFIIACDIKKINYENVILLLHEHFPKVTEYMIKGILKEAFKNWLEKYPTIAEQCPKISLISLLKVFAKRFK